MMKEYFLQFFKYDKYANEAMLKCIMDAGEPELPVKLMAHLLRAQQVWLSRCAGLPPTDVALWPDWKAGTFQSLINENHNGWTGFLQTVQPEDFDKVINYKTFKGEPFDNKLVDILGHVINHGTHHRAQIGQHVKLAGLENLPNTDYVAFVRYVL